MSSFEDPLVIVHLVHGTWPFGPFQKSSSLDKPCWFEPGGRLYRSLSEFNSRGVELMPFLWTGKNSFEARTRAADDFRRRLQETHEIYPAAQQVVVAHSHGGTLVAEALAGTSTLVRRTLPPLAAFICMATPFTYQIPRQGRGRLSVSLACASALTGLLSLILLLAGTWGSHNLFSVLAAHVLIIISLTLVCVLLDISSGRSRDFGLIPYETPVYLLRSTRDEASLSIGLTQAMHWMFGLLYKPTTFGLAFFLPFLLTPLLMHLTRNTLTQVATLDSRELFVACFFMSQSVVPAIYLVCTACLAIATGAWNPRDWAKHIIETETTPVGHTCSVKSYRDSGTLLTGLRVFKTGGARHSLLYDQDEVLYDIRYLIDDVLEQVRPSLVNTGYQLGRHSRHH